MFNFISNTTKNIYKKIYKCENFTNIRFDKIITCAILSKLSYKNPNDISDNELPFKMNSKPIFFNNEITDAQAYIWVLDDIIYLSFRGTSNIKDALIDINIIPTSLENNVKIHSGFYIQFKSLEKNILKTLNSLEFSELNICGHSLGGAISTISAYYFGKLFQNKKVNCYTIGSPRVGNYNFIKAFKENVNENYRINNDEDPVALVPLNNNYIHVENNIVLDETTFTCYKWDCPFYIRPLISLLNIDFKKPVEEHDCTLYIERLKKLVY